MRIPLDSHIKSIRENAYDLTNPSGHYKEQKWKKKLIINYFSA